MYSVELEKHRKEKEEWKVKAQKLIDQASALQVDQQSITDDRIYLVVLSAATPPNQHVIFCYIGNIF